MQLVVDNTVLGPLTLNTERVRVPTPWGVLSSLLSPTIRYFGHSSFLPVLVIMPQVTSEDKQFELT